MQSQKEREQEKLEQLLYGNPFDQDIPPQELYKLLLKRKRIGSYLSQALREAGLEDIAKRTKFSRQTLSEEDME